MRRALALTILILCASAVGAQTGGPAPTLAPTTTAVKAPTTNDWQLVVQEPPPGAPTVALAGAGAGNVANGAHRVRVTFTTAAGHSQQGTASSIVTVVDKTVNGQVAISGIPTGSNFVTGRKVYMTTAGGSVYRLLSNGTIANNTATTLTANDSDATLLAAAALPNSNTTANQIMAYDGPTGAVTVAGGTVGPGTVTSVSGTANQISVATGTSTPVLSFASPLLRFGAADAAAPVAQTLSVQNVVAGTSNTAGANFTIAGSQGTGTGAGGSLIFQVAPAGSTGTAVNALATALTIDSTKTVTASTAFSGPTVGVTTNSDAATGQVGEYISNTVTFPSRVALTTGTTKTVTSITLGAGDWDVSGIVNIFPAATTNVTTMAGSIALIDNTAGSNPTGRDSPSGGVVFGSGSFGTGLPVIRKRISVASSTPIYLIARCDFTVAGCDAYGFIDARRIR